MNYFYTQQVGGNETWKPIREDKLDTLNSPMFVTVLSVDVPVSDEATREQLAEVKYKGLLYFDLDDANSPASTAIHAQNLVSKLEEEGVFSSQLEIYASGGKGFHVLVPEECFLTKPPKSGVPLLPAIYKEMAFSLAVDSMDFRVYTARKGRMFRCANVLRPNGLYKVRISAEELEKLADLAKEDTAAAEANYKILCSTPRKNFEVSQDSPCIATGMLALYDAAKAKVSKAATKTKKQKPVRFPAELPSFDALLRGEGIKDDVGFHPIAMQIAITAHARGMTLNALLEKAEGLCENHASDGFRYNSPAKRRQELARMYDYTDDNPCYIYSPHALTGLLTHSAPDLHGLEVSAEEVKENIDSPDESEDTESEFGHANVIMTRQGIFTMTEAGPKQLTATSFDNVIELRSGEDGGIIALEADMKIGSRLYPNITLTLEDFSSVNGLNKMIMRYGQAFSGNDAQARGVYMRIIEKARKGNNSMYVIAKEGLSVVKIAFHEDEEAKKGFLVWADGKRVIVQPSMEEKGMALKFVGFPEKAGQFQTDLSSAPALGPWLKEEGNKEKLQVFLQNLLNCQSPTYLGKLLGWTMACHYRAMFHEIYSQFPMLHINGAAGAGKTAMTRLFSNLHYYMSEPKMLTPTSTVFAVTQAVSSSSSIPLILDEFKPGEMVPATYDKFKLLLRDAYNSRSVEKGGGTRENSDYRSVHKTQLSAPICFIAEAAESESALMERVVLLTLVKPPVVRQQVYLAKFMAAVNGREMLGILGHYCSAQIVKRMSVQALEDEFLPIYDATRRELMLQDGEEFTLSTQEIAKKSGAKERTVYNYSVCRYGLTKLHNLIHQIFGDEFDAVFAEMQATVCSTVSDIQDQTLPEWLKVLNTFADMSKVDPMLNYHLVEGKDFASVSYGGKNCIELYLRSCYFKYRAYSAASRTKPLFPSESAFTHALNSLPALMAKGVSVDLEVPGGSHVLDLDELRAAGFMSP